MADVEFPETTPILPGETQRLRATGTLPLPAGTEYTLDGSIDFGGEDPAEASTDFTVDEVSPEAGLTVCENLDRGPTITLRLASEGEIGLSATVSLVIDDVSGNQLVATSLPDSVLIWPGDEQTIATDAPTRLETGTYTLVAMVRAGAGDPLMVEFPFEIGGASPETAPLCPPPATLAT